MKNTGVDIFDLIELDENGQWKYTDNFDKLKSSDKLELSVTKIDDGIGYFFTIRADKLVEKHCPYGSIKTIPAREVKQGDFIKFYDELAKVDRIDKATGKEVFEYESE